MTKNITENINKTEIITKKIISLFIPICLLLISFSLVNCPDPGTDTSTPGNGNGNGNGNGGGQPDVPPQIIVEYRSGVTNKEAVQSGFLLSLRDEPAGDVSVSVTIYRSDSSGTATVNLKGGTASATSSFIFTQQNWNIPQEFKLVYGNPTDPDPANVKIVFSVTSTADPAYNDLTYIVSGNLTHLGIPEFRIHVHDAQSAEPEDTDSYYTVEAACRGRGTWDSDASTCTVDDDRNIKVWFSLEPSIASTGQAAACAAADGLWSDPHCISTPEETCKKAGDAWDSATSTCGSITAEFACNNIYGDWDSANNICTIALSRSCVDSGNLWKNVNAVCGLITAADACTASGNTWDGTNEICEDSGSNTITAENACLATSGNVWNSTTSACGSVGLEDTCPATLYGTWDGTKCVIMPETACEEARGVFDSINSTCSIATDLACDKALHTWINKAEPVCAITNPQSHDSDITITYTLTDETASAGTDYTAPTTTTATIPASSTSAYIEIPLGVDSINPPSDEGDETFKISITSVNTLGANLIVADTDATVIIGDPNETSNYFFPNRPLMRGEKDATTTPVVTDKTPSFQCYVVAEGKETQYLFAGFFADVRINNSTDDFNIGQLNSSDIINSLDLSQYASENTARSLLTRNSYRAYLHLFFAPGGSGYNPINNHSYTCSSLLNLGGARVPPIKNVPLGRFGMLEFGQAYEYE